MFHLFDGTLRLNTLKRLLPNCTQRMLTKQLRELEEEELIARKVYAEVPPKVEYSLTEKGRSLEPVIRALKNWGAARLRGPEGSQGRGLISGLSWPEACRESPPQRRPCYARPPSRSRNPRRSDGPRGRRR